MIPRENAFSQALKTTRKFIACPDELDHGEEIADLDLASLFASTTYVNGDLPDNIDVGKIRKIQEESLRGS